MSAIIPYFGGKQRLLKTILKNIPEHMCYVEVFAGGAGVLFAKEPAKSEVLNDLDKELITFYRVIKYHPEEFHRQFKYSLVARDEFQRLLKVNPETLTDIQRACRYFYLQKNAFGGKVTGQTFGTSTTAAPRFNLFSLEQIIQDAWTRLAQVTIERLDFRELIPRYDRDHTFYFLDPPYWGIPGYRHDFKEQDFADLAGLLYNVKGKFLMTLNNRPEVRNIFSGFNIEDVQLKYSMSKEGKSRAKSNTELLISNY